MIKNIVEIQEKIEEGTLQEYTTTNLELKKSWSQAVGKKISAFANNILESPIWLCIGIDDNGNISGHNESWAKNTEETISQHLNQYLDPQITCSSITCHSNESGWFITVLYENPGAVVYWNNKAYKGIGTTTQEMNPAEIMKLTVALPGLTDYSAQKYVDSLDKNSIVKFGDIIRGRKTDSPIINFQSLDPDNILTRLGIKDTRTSHVLFGSVQYRVVFYDKSGNPVKNETRNGLFGMLDESFIIEIQSWSKSQLNTNTNPYPEKAIKEAIANAVAHAAYVEKSGDIIIELFTDKMCISNLCMAESVYFANKWFSRGHNTINRTLMEILRIGGFVDELGRGKNLIFAESLRHGKRPPEVLIDKVGRYDRWRLNLYGGAKNRIQLRLLNRLRQLYSDEQKVLIANALVLWNGSSVSDFKPYVDGDSSGLFAEVIADINGPIFYNRKKDSFYLQRWVRVLLGEGKDSKQLTPSEEASLQAFTKKFTTDYHDRYITPKQLRELAGMGNTSAEQVLSSKLLKKWSDSGVVKKERRGLYRFPEPKKEKPSVNLKEVIKQILVKP
jgi:predicted HTH transcriptional regulator